MLSSTSMAARQAAAFFLFFFTVHIVPPVVCCRLKLSKTPEAPAAVCRHLQPAMPHIVPASGPLQPVHGFRARKDTPAAALRREVPSDG